jgi:hypothetical protein
MDTRYPDRIEDVYFMPFPRPQCDLENCGHIHSIYISGLGHPWFMPLLLQTCDRKFSRNFFDALLLVINLGKFYTPLTQDENNILMI